MQLTGLAFLRMPATRSLVAFERVALLLPLCWKHGALRRTVTALWTGPDADAFYRAHQTRLRAGCALNVTLVDLHPHKDRHGIDLHAQVIACELAPARWEDHATDSHQAIAA